MIPTAWLPTFVLAVCGAVIPGPCGYAPDPAFDCSSGDPCPRNLACVIVDDDSDRGFCRSADIACDDGSVLCAVPGLDRSGLCVDEADFLRSSAHCGDCFARCRGGASCVDGACLDEPAAGTCLLARGNFDCRAGQGCRGAAADNADNDNEHDVGACVDGAAGAGATLAGCDDGDDCDGGLCAGGVCTRPCDFGCPPGTACEVGGVPGGLCVPVAVDGCFG